MRRFKMKKFLLLITVLVMSMTLFVGCSSNDTQNEGTDTNETEVSTNESSLEILVPGYDSGYLTEQLDELTAKYVEENPGVEIKIISAGWEELNSKVVQLYQAKQSPDIMLLGSRSLRQFSELGVAEDLGPYMTDEFKADRIENVLETGAVNGTQYGIPMALSSRALFYRTDLIETPPTNWDELLATAKKVNEEKNIYGFAIPTDLASGTDEILSFIYQGGGAATDENGEFTINSSENIETLTYLTELKDFIPDPVATARGDQVQMFINGDLAMFVSGAWEIAELEKNKEAAPYGIAKLPTGKQEGVSLVTDSYVMSSISENKEEAWRFIEFMGQPEQQKIITDAYKWFPVIEAENEVARYQEDNMKPFMEIMPSGTAEPQVPNWDEFNKSFLIAVQKALTGEATPEEALNTAQEEVSK